MRVGSRAGLSPYQVHMGTGDDATVALAEVDAACRGVLRRAGQLDLEGKRDLAMRMRELAARIGHATLAARRRPGADRDALAHGATRLAERVRDIAELAANLVGKVPTESIAAGTAAIALACTHAAEVAAAGFATPALDPAIDALARERTFFLDQVRYYNGLT